MAYRGTIRYQRKDGVGKTDSDENERHEETASAETHLRGGARRPLRLSIGRGMGFIPDLENLGGSGQSKIGDALQEN